MIQSWLSARVTRDFISHSLHSVVAWFVIGLFVFLHLEGEKVSQFSLAHWIFPSKVNMQAKRKYSLTLDNFSLSSQQLHVCVYSCVSQHLAERNVVYYSLRSKASIKQTNRNQSVCLLPWNVHCGRQCASIMLVTSTCTVWQIMCFFGRDENTVHASMLQKLLDS